MKYFFLSGLILFFANSLFASDEKVEVVQGSVFTDFNKDCIVVSEATDLAPIDFYEAECKAYGGYSLQEDGGDLRYGPRLSYAGKEIDLQRPFAFHSMASSKVEWVYELKRNSEGEGKIQFKALIYELVTDDEWQGRSFEGKLLVYVVRLQGAKSCVTGVTSSREAARKIAHKSNAKCVKLSDR
jgi:hypothetical protein